MIYTLIKGRHFLLVKYKSHFIQARMVEMVEDLIIRKKLGYGRLNNGKCQEN